MWAPARQANRPKSSAYALRVWPHPPSRACATSRIGRSYTMQSVSTQLQYDPPPGSGQAPCGNRRRFINRKPLGDTPYFSVPIALYDAGLARCLRPAEFKRYCTLLRELRKLDGISERASWRINRKLQEYGLIRVLPARPFTYLLNRPESWRPPKSYGPKITQASPLRVTDKDLPATPGQAHSQQRVLDLAARSA